MNKLNKGFGKIVQESNIEYAPDSFTHDGVDFIHPTPNDYRAVGYLPVVMSNPSGPAPEGYHWEADGFEEAAGEIHNKWKQAKDPVVPPKPRAFSKMKIIEGLMSYHLWEEAKQWIIDHDMYDLYLAAQIFSDDNNNFNDGVAAIAAALHLEQYQIDDILDNAEIKE